MARPTVPKFGNLDDENGGSKITNPNDPQENPEIFEGAHRSYAVENSPARQRPAVRSSKPSAGTDRSVDRSPLHPHGTPSRSRPRPPATPNRGDESPEEGATVPRFGEWDENDPQSAENFTHIFNKVREERSAGAGNHTPRHPSSYEPRPKQQKDPKKCCCFPSW